MANKIQFRRGTKAKLPTLSAGEPAFCPDTRELFIGTGSGNINMGGSMWYKGTAMSGTVTTTGYYYYSACPQVKVGDTYLNTSNGNIYECTTAGSGQAAKWTYKGCIKGAQGNPGTNGNDGKDAGTYVVTTTAELNAAVTALNSSDYGGKIIIRECGEYDLGTITFTNNVIFQGLNKENTIIKHSGRWSTKGSQLSFRDITVETANPSGHSDDTASLYFDHCIIKNNTENTYPERGQLYHGTGDFVSQNSEILFQGLYNESPCTHGIDGRRVAIFGGKVSCYNDNGNTIVFCYTADEFIMHAVCYTGNHSSMVKSDRVELVGNVTKGTITGCTFKMYNGAKFRGNSAVTFTGNSVYFYGDVDSGLTIAFGSITGNIFYVNTQSLTLYLTWATVMTGNHFKGYAVTISGVYNKQLVTLNTSDNGVTVIDTASGSIITNNITY